MGAKIHRLSESTINQIAAGEVIESPASVVKELVENAIDAGAHRVTIEIGGGGFHLIRVSDDGEGMGPEDLPLALERHATSKIALTEDLLRLQTMGFRGEALASIAAISKLSLLSCDVSGEAMQVVSEGGKILSMGPAARSQGTTVEVRSLFYNVPARKKFQKSAVGCSAEVLRTVNFLSLAHPDVGFELILQEKKVLFLPPLSSGNMTDRLMARAKEVLGDLLASSTSRVFFEESNLRIEGVISSPTSSRHNRTGQFLFVNRRPVNSALLSYAVKEGYGTRLDSDRHPLFALHVTVPSALVDVNVHPQKKEVRFQEAAHLKEQVTRAIFASLQPASTGTASSFAEWEMFQPLGRSLWPQRAQETAVPLRFQEAQEGAPRLFAEEAPGAIGLFSHYLLLNGQEPSALILVDLFAALRRILFDQVTQGIGGVVEKQGLLLPETLSVSSEELHLVEGNAEAIERMGISARAFGRRAIVVEAIPTFLEVGDLPKVFEEIFAVLRREEVLSLHPERLKRLAHVIACFVGAHKKSFVLQEAERVYQQLMRTSLPHQCPRGKPTMHSLTADEIKGFFHA